ncbi:MAG: ABC transporter ATP-binding protein, partial [Candidatus Heimdallarchaeota archaeon]
AETNIIMVTHDMDLVDQVANRILVMSENKVIADGKTDKIFTNSEILKRSNLKPPVRVEMLSFVKDLLNK